MSISLAVTAYQETKSEDPLKPSITDCIKPAVDHPLIDEIVVVDDSSSDYTELEEMLMYYEKVQLHCNQENLGVFGNKLKSVYCAKGDWVICCDSDNTMSREYIDKVSTLKLQSWTWYCPSFAKPQFDYRDYIGVWQLHTLKQMVARGGLAGCLLNTGNQIVHRKTFLSVFKQYLDKRADLMMPNWLQLSEEDRKSRHYRIVFDACDSLIFNKIWLERGGMLEVVEGLEYDHYWTGGDDSHYNRAPKEKHQLNELLMEKLCTR